MDRPKKLPGDRATYDKECLSKRRTSEGYCLGRGLGEACSIARGYYCDVGMYCAADATCKNVKHEGEPCSALNECATYLICNMGTPVQVCTMPYSLQPMTYGHFTGIAQLCSTGWINGTIFMCKPPAEFAPGTQMINPILFEKEELCKYTDGSVLDGSCMYFSKDPMSVIYCQPYNETYMSKLADIKAYLEEKPNCGEGLFNVFCDRELERINPCKVKKALQGVLYSQVIFESHYADCWEKTYTMTSELYTCSAVRTSVLSALLILAFLVFTTL